MTFTIIARDPETGELGIGIATYSLAVGATCPHIGVGIGAVSTQAFTNADLGPDAIDMLGEGRPAAEVLNLLKALDVDFEYRQVGIIPAIGSVAIHTGSHARDWAGHVITEHALTMGNGLAGQQVVEGMMDDFEAAGGSLAGRLLAGLEAGRNAGGQEPSPGNHLAERSSVLLVYGEGLVATTDLRVDVHETAIDELRRVYELYSTYAPYYDQRHRSPSTLDAQEVWTKANVANED
ncbi:MAG: DUF1028 domain-containing protein [Chloroflexi bacterium]|nr:DUF1028 domain-containing protein [Chloroflexota bacterium]